MEEMRTWAFAVAVTTGWVSAAQLRTTGDLMLAETSTWFTERTWQNPPWTQQQLLQAKGARTVSVVLPALNEQATVGAVVATVLPFVGSLVDECVVVDSGSTDRTIAVARDAGARVIRHRDILPDLPPLPGKGEVLWRSLAATAGEVLLFLDSDLIDPDPGFIPALLGPILTEPGVHLVKGFYRRPLRLETTEAGTGGGRVTELLARPVLSALCPELSGVIQPLGGEYAITRELGESVPFAAGYGVEIGLLLDAHTRYGLAGLAQVNLGVRKHRNRSLQQLGVMARQILGTALARTGQPAQGTSAFTQFIQVDGEWLPDATEVLVADRPAIRELRQCSLDRDIAS
jgi:glucosyl-3-phosphoglycerate synthase